MKVVVARYEDGEPIYNTRFLAFATHYGFRPVACRPRRPQTKGKVERPFLYIEKNLLSGREFRSLEHLNEVAAWWLKEVADVREHRQTRRRPIDLHAEELPHLIPLPERPYEVAEVVYRTVDAEGFIPYGNNRYSVPWHYLGQVLPVRITDEAVAVYSPRLELLARHVRFPATERHRQSRQPEHLPPRDLARRREPARAVRRVGGLGGTVLRASCPAGLSLLRLPIPRQCLGSLGGRAWLTPLPSCLDLCQVTNLDVPRLPASHLGPMLRGVPSRASSRQPLTWPPVAAKVAPFLAVHNTQRILGPVRGPATLLAYGNSVA